MKLARSFVLQLLEDSYQSIVGSVVECSPATRAARVRFPDDASFFFCQLWSPPKKIQPFASRLVAAAYLFQELPVIPSSILWTLTALAFGNGHTILNTPVLVRSPKLSNIGPG